jgi:hypothetical protein
MVGGLLTSSIDTRGNKSNSHAKFTITDTRGNKSSGPG